MMNEVWIVTESDWECGEVRGVYATKQQAEIAIVEHIRPEFRYWYSAERWILSAWKMPPIPPDHYIKEVTE